MIYKIDNINISTFGAVPTNVSGEKIALSGLFDLPKRKGTTEYDWGTSIEAFTDEDDIILDGRTLTLNVAIKGSSISDLHTKVDTFKAACIHCTKLYSELSGEINVIQKDDISVTEYAGIIAIVKVPFWQEVYVPAAISIVPSTTGNYMLDTYNLIKDFGIYITSLSEVNDTAKRIDIDTTLPYMCTSYRSAYDLIFKCKMSGQTLQDLYSKMSQFNALCIKSGLRTLKLPNNELKVYFKDGISVKVESGKNLSFDLKCRVIT